MNKKYALKKDLDDVRMCLLKLSQQVNEIAKWQAYYTIKKNPNVFNAKQRKEILETAKGHVTYPLFLQLFKEYPLGEK